MSFDKNKKYGTYQGKNYTLKDNSSMVYLQKNKYQVYQFSWDQTKNKYVQGSPVNIEPEKADYVIKDYYYPYEFMMDEKLIQMIKSNNFQMPRRIQEYQESNIMIGGKQHLWWDILKNILISLADKSSNGSKKGDIQKLIRDNKKMLGDQVSEKVSYSSSNITKIIDGAYQEMLGGNMIEDGINWIYDLNADLIKSSIRLATPVIVFSGKKAIKPNTKITYDIQHQVGDIINYYVPISTSIDLATAFGFFWNKSKKFIEKNIGMDKTKNLCCLYRYILPPGYPIYLVQSGSKRFDHEQEILLPFVVNDKINKFRVVDMTTYKLKIQSDGNYNETYQGNKIAYNNIIDEDEDAYLMDVTIITCKSMLFD